MASGSSGRPSPGSKGFDFASDDILCSYDDFANQESANGSHSDPSIGTNSTMDFQKSRISRSSVFPTANAYGQQDECLSQEVILTVERTIKKHFDNLMRFLEGISSRLSQLELYCYNLDKSIGEMRSDLARDNGEADSKLKFLEKHLQEVHRSVQILRDKQELAETQKELAKLQLAQKGSSSPSQDEKSTVSASEPKKNEDVSDVPNTQLALALPSQIAQQPSHPASQSVAPPQPLSQTHSQLQPYYLPSNQLPNPQVQSHPSYLAPDSQYRVPQLAPQAPQQSQSQVNQTPQTQQFPQYQQQWPQQVSQPMQLPQQSQQPPPSMQPPQQPPSMQPPQQPPSMQPSQQPPSIQPPQQPPSIQPPQQQSQQPPMQPHNQVRAPNPHSSIYPPYMTSQSANQPPPEAMSSSMPMQMPMPYGYGGASRPVQPQSSPPHMKGGFPSQPGDGYATVGSHPPISSAGSYMLYDSEGGRSHHPQPTHYSQGAYPPTNPSVPNLAPQGSSGLMIRNPGPQHYVRNHPYNELIDKLVSMGYRGDHVVNVIQRLEESGQAVDFNAVLDRLNGHSSGSSQRSW